MGKYNTFNKRIYFYFLTLVFLMFFSTTNVYARLDEGGGGNGTTKRYYGVECFYDGKVKVEDKFNPTASGSIGGDNETTTEFVYGIDVYCKGKNGGSACTSIGAVGHGQYGLKVDGTTKNLVLKEKNYDDFMNQITSNAKSFGYKEGEGINSCPSSIYYKAPVGSSESAINVEFSLTKKDGFTQAKLSSGKTIKYNKGEGGKLEQDVSDIADTKKSVTTGGGHVYDTTSGTLGSAIDGDSTIDISSIIGYYKVSDIPDVDTGISPDDEINCYELLGDDVASLIKNAALAISVVGVIILVVTLSFDFIKAVTSGDNDALPKAFSNAKNRIIAVIVLLLLPMLVSAIVSLANNNLVTDEYGNIKVGNVSDCIGSN